MPAMLLNIPMPTFIPILFFVVLMAVSFFVGFWLQGKETRRNYDFTEDLRRRNSGTYGH